jgi:hypothetical protein
MFAVDLLNKASVRARTTNSLDATSAWDTMHCADILHNDKTGAEGIGKKAAQSFPILTARKFDTTRSSYLKPIYESRVRRSLKVSTRDLRAPQPSGSTGSPGNP